MRERSWRLWRRTKNRRKLKIEKTMAPRLTWALIWFLFRHFSVDFEQKNCVHPRFKYYKIQQHHMQCTWQSKTFTRTLHVEKNNKKCTEVQNNITITIINIPFQNAQHIERQSDTHMKLVRWSKSQLLAQFVRSTSAHAVEDVVIALCGTLDTDP
jgi:hypothetical protein